MPDFIDFQNIDGVKYGIIDSLGKYPGVDLTSKFAEEIAGYTDPGAWIRARIRANNFDGIHVNDYIPFTTTNGLKFKARVAPLRGDLHEQPPPTPQLLWDFTRG